MQSAGKEIWNRYGLPSFVSDIVDLLDSPLTFLRELKKRRMRKPITILEAGDPILLPLYLQRWLYKAEPKASIVIEIMDACSPDLVEMRWGTALRISSKMLCNRQWTVNSLNPKLSALGSEAI
jgi:hypothetical protein